MPNGFQFQSAIKQWKKYFKYFAQNSLKKLVDWDQYFVARKGTMMTLITSKVKNPQCNWFLSDSFSVGRLHLFKKPIIYSLNHCNYERSKSWCNELKTLFNSVCFAHWICISDTDTGSISIGCFEVSLVLCAAKYSRILLDSGCLWF